VPDFVNGIMDLLRNMECVKANLGSRSLFPNPRLRGLGHIHRDEPNGLRLPIATDEIVFEGSKNVRLSPFCSTDPATGPRKLSLNDLAAVVAFYSWQCCIQKGFELEKMKMMPSSPRSIMNRLVSRSAGRATLSLGVASKIRVDSALI
jgi:hypothetical protein